MRIPALFLNAAVLAIPLAAQTPCPLVKDINTTSVPLNGHPTPGRAGPGGTSPRGFVQCGANWYLFAAGDTWGGGGLWKTDGTAAGTQLIKKIIHGSGGSPTCGGYLLCCNGRVYFQADDGISGCELWTSDGTAAGTRLVKDIRPGPASSAPNQSECMGNKIYFSADDGAATPTGC